MKYTPTIGLEIHAELKTRTKMFCGCVNNPDEKTPNMNICPVCMGHPGTLPTVNIEAMKQVLRVGVALKGELADWTEFDRKNYFYPDIPKGYQISQYKYPLVSGGELKGIKITRIHLEEDTGSSLHGDKVLSAIPAQAGIQDDSPGPRLRGDDKDDYSFVDYNRAGVPLMELVTEPVIHDAKTAADFGKELQLVLRYLGASGANMEKGELRIEANISVYPVSDIKNSDGAIEISNIKKSKLGTKVEVKNLNSFRAVERAIEFEILRQTEILERGEDVVQETRGWDEAKQKTFSQRKKEESHDYRYFPEPDIPKFKLSEIYWAAKKNIRKELPELPDEKRARFLNDYGIKKEDIEFFVTNRQLGDFFELVAKKIGNDKKLMALASNYITSDLTGILKYGKSMDKLLPESFAELITMTGKKELSSRGAKNTLAKLVEDGGEARAAAKTLGLIQNNDHTEAGAIVEKIISANPKVVADYKGGKTAALQFLIGQVMKETKGSASPDMAKSLLTDRLK